MMFIEKKDAVTRQTIISLAALGVIGGFCIGFIHALSHIIPHRYLYYGMYRLSADILREQLNNWFLASLLTVAAVVILRSAFRFVSSLISSIGKRPGTDTGDGTDKRTVNYAFTAILSIMMICLILVSTGWVMTGIFPFKLFGKESSLLMIVLLIWSFVRKRQKTLIYLVEVKALLVLAILLCLNIGILVTNSRAIVPGPNIILLVIDCLRPDHLGFHGYGKETSPAIDRLAENGMVCTHSYSNAPWTKPSVATLFTSSYPQVHGAVNPSQALSNTALTIAELLGNSGYKTLFINGGNLFIDERFNFGQGFDYYQYLPHATKSAVDVTYSFLSQIEEKENEKFFAYLHYMDTHAPYAKNHYNKFLHQKGEGQNKINDNNIKCNTIRALTANGGLTEQQKKNIIALYDSQIRYVDEHIQMILTFLKKKQLLQNTVVIVTSDHGEEFWEHDNYEHGHTLYNELLRVPLIMSGANIKPSKITASVSLIDVLPTVLEIAGIQHDTLNLQGVSLLEIVKHNGNNHTGSLFATGTLYGSEKYCLIRDNKKMIITTDRKERKWNLIGHKNENRRELYDIRNDAFERNNLINAHDDDRLSMERDLELFVRMPPAFQGETEELEVVIDSSLRERLGSLGYLE